MDFGSVDGDIVADGYVVAYLDGGFTVESVKHRAVLYVHTVADTDGVHVAAEHGVEPHAAFVAHGDIANNGGILGQKTVAAYHGVVAPYRNDECHMSGFTEGLVIIRREAWSWP